MAAGCKGGILRAKDRLWRRPTGAEVLGSSKRKTQSSENSRTPLLLHVVVSISVKPLLIN
ncbi:hypothetical protein A2U01_0077895, partial [Trifolium medium]|nr:hypothetical protein [Trifolium medium]